MITSLDLAIAGFKPPESFVKATGTMEAAGVWHSLWLTAGRPGTATAYGTTGATGLTGQTLSSSSAQVAGQLPVPPANGNTHLARLVAQGGLAGMLILADRLWENNISAVTTTGAQTVDSPAWPTRDENGTSDGDDIQIALEVKGTITGNAGAITNTTMVYTNDGGTGSKTGSIASFPISGQPGTFVPFSLAAGDRGVRSVQSVTLGTSYVSGAIGLVAYRILAMLPLPTIYAGNEKDLVSLGMPRLYDGSVPFLIWVPTATTAHSVAGQVVYTQG